MSAISTIEREKKSYGDFQDSSIKFSKVLQFQHTSYSVGRDGGLDRVPRIVSTAPKPSSNLNSNIPLRQEMKLQTPKLPPLDTTQHSNEPNSLHRMCVEASVACPRVREEVTRYGVVGQRNCINLDKGRRDCIPRFTSA